jgi:hypothetical protein
VSLCRNRGVVTPEAPFPIWEGEGRAHLLTPLFLLYDYSFRPDIVRAEDAVEWAIKSGLTIAPSGPPRTVLTEGDLLRPSSNRARDDFRSALSGRGSQGAGTAGMTLPQPLSKLSEEVVSVAEAPLLEDPFTHFTQRLDRSLSAEAGRASGSARRGRLVQVHEDGLIGDHKRYEVSVETQGEVPADE